MTKSWITSLRTFSNNDYWNPRYMNWGSLKVINDDTQQPGGCVPTHEHKNYDIFGYIVSGTLKHTDSLGNNVVAQAGQIQHIDRKSTRLNSSHVSESRMPSSA